MEFEELVVENRDLAKKVAYSIMKNREDAKEVAQQACARAIENKDKFKMGTNFEAWFTTLTKGIANTRIKRRSIYDHKKKNHRTSIHQMVYDLSGDKRPEDLDKFLEILEDELHEKFYKTLVLVYLMDKKYKEVAKELDCPVGTIMSRARRAKKKSRDILLEHFPKKLLSEFGITFSSS